MKIGMMVNGSIFSYDGESSQAFEDSRNAFMEAVTAAQTTQDSGCSCTREVPKNRVDVSSTKRYIDGSIDDIMQAPRRSHQIRRYGGFSAGSWRVLRLP